MQIQIIIDFQINFIINFIYQRDAQQNTEKPKNRIEKTKQDDPQTIKKRR